MLPPLELVRNQIFECIPIAVLHRDIHYSERERLVSMWIDAALGRIRLWALFFGDVLFKGVVLPNKERGVVGDVRDSSQVFIMLRLWLGWFLANMNFSVFRLVEILLILLLELLTFLTAFNTQLVTKFWQVGSLFDPGLVVANNVWVVETGQ